MLLTPDGPYPRGLAWVGQSSDTSWVAIYPSKSDFLHLLRGDSYFTLY